MLKKIALAGAGLAALATPIAAQAQGHNRDYYRDCNHYYYDGHHYRDRNNHAIIDTIIGALFGYGLGVATTGGYGYNTYPSYGYGYSYPTYGYNYGYSQPAYGYSPYGYSGVQVLVIPGYTYRNGYYYDSYGRYYTRDYMNRRYGHHHRR
jgi:hypothetical protein